MFLLVRSDDDFKGDQSQTAAATSMCDLLILVTVVEGSVTGDGENTRYNGVRVGEERFVWPFISIPLQPPSSVPVTTIQGAGF